MGTQGRWRQDRKAAVGEKGVQPPRLHEEGFGKVSWETSIRLRVDMPGFWRNRDKIINLDPRKRRASADIRVIVAAKSPEPF